MQWTIQWPSKIARQFLAICGREVVIVTKKICLVLGVVNVTVLVFIYGFVIGVNQQDSEKAVSQFPVLLA